METNDNADELTFDIFTMVGVYGLLIFLSYIAFWTVLWAYPTDVQNYQTVKQVIDYAHVIMPLVMFMMTAIHGALYLMEAYFPIRQPEESGGEE